MYALIIIMSGILISTRFAFIITIIISFALIFISYLQINSIIVPKTYWRNENIEIDDPIIFAITLLVIMTITWLYNREIEKSLKRALSSEKALQKERDSLDVKVKERTRELKEEQTKRISELYRFYEFGQLSAGVFHDLINRMTNVSLHMEQLMTRRGIKDHISEEVDEVIRCAAKSVEHMEAFAEAAQKQVKGDSKKEIFSIIQEINDCLMIMGYKAKKEGVELTLADSENRKQDIKLYGDKFKFNQIMVNLISNAIDSYKNLEKENRRCEVLITVDEDTNIICIIIQDWGRGIKNKHLDKIFTPFFTTKKTLGLGLSTTKKIIERNFNGRIMIESTENEGTKAILKFSTQDINKKMEEYIKNYSCEV